MAVFRWDIKRFGASVYVWRDGQLIMRCADFVKAPNWYPKTVQALYRVVANPDNYVSKGRTTIYVKGCK